MKIQRNAVEELTLLASFAGHKQGLETSSLQTEACRLFNRTAPKDWWTARPSFADTPTSEWTGPALDEATKPAMSHLAHIDPEAWARVRGYILRLAAEGEK